MKLMLGVNTLGWTKLIGFIVILLTMLLVTTATNFFDLLFYFIFNARQYVIKFILFNKSSSSFLIIGIICYIRLKTFLKDGYIRLNIHDYCEVVFYYNIFILLLISNIMDVGVFSCEAYKQSWSWVFVLYQDRGNFECLTLFDEIDISNFYNF